MPFAAGGPTDVIARIVAQKLSEDWGQQVYIENVPRRGRQHRRRHGRRERRADGYTILVVSTGFIVNPSLYAKMPYDPVKDFAPITLVAASPNVMVGQSRRCRPRSMKELVELIKANPGKYSFAQPGHRLDAASRRANCSSSTTSSTWSPCPFNGAALGRQLDHRRPHADRIHGAAAGA